MKRLARLALLTGVVSCRIEAAPIQGAPEPYSYVAERVGRSALPALLWSDDPGTGVFTRVELVADTLVVRPNGSYSQYWHLETREGTVFVGPSSKADHGTYTRDTAGYYFRSSMPSISQFSATSDSAGYLYVTQDLSGQNSGPQVYTFRPPPAVP